MYILTHVPDMYYAETQLKIFLEANGYTPDEKTRKCDWFVLEHEKVF